MESPTLELRTALASLLEDPKYSDLTVVCRGKRYPVHRALLATRSTFFEGVCRNDFIEAQTRVVDLSEDDAGAVEYMVHYFYHLDYLNKATTPRKHQCESTPALTSCPAVSKKLNFALIENPLLASASWTNDPLPPTPPEEVEVQNSDALAKLSASPLTNQSAVNDYFENEQPATDTNLETPHLVTHAKVYAIAEKYGIAGLKSLSRKKFIEELDLALQSTEFAEACQEAYESTFHTDRGLRDVIIQAFRANPDLSMRPDVELMVRETPSLAFELFRMVSGLPVTS